MIRSALLLVRTAPLSTLVLAAALLALVNLLSAPSGDTSDPVDSIPSLAPIMKAPRATAVDGGALRTALFDPAHRPETMAGSIDDLRPNGQAAPDAPVTIAGVLLAGGTRKAMLSVGGAAPTWNGVGAELAGWRVASVNADGAVIEREGQSQTLRVADRYKLRGRPQPDPGSNPAPAVDASTPADARPAPGDVPPPPQ